MTFMISFSITLGFFCLFRSSYKFQETEYFWAFYLIAIGMLYFSVAVAMFKDYLKR